MIKLMKASLAALIAVGSVAAAATPAAAEGHWDHDGHGWNHGGGWDHDRDGGWRGDERWEHRRGSDSGALIAGGLAGLALGAALSSHHNGYGHSGYGYGYDYRYGGYGPPRVCIERRTEWDPYYGEYIVRPIRYPC